MVIKTDILLYEGPVPEGLLKKYTPWQSLRISGVYEEINDSVPEHSREITSDGFKLLEVLKGGDPFQPYFDDHVSEVAFTSREKLLEKMIEEAKKRIAMTSFPESCCLLGDINFPYVDSKFAPVTHPEGDPFVAIGPKIHITGQGILYVENRLLSHNPQ